MSRIYRGSTKILYNRVAGPGYYLMGLEADGLIKSARPGQFVYIRCSDDFDPLLRRPFSIHRVNGGGFPRRSLSRVKSRDSGQTRVKAFEILYEIVGKGTKNLSKKKRGDKLNIIGPLGNSFMLSSAFNLQLSAILIAGGMGVAPLVFLAEELSKQKIKTTVLIGARTKKLILCEKDFKRLGAEVHIATDDGTYGFKGFVSGLFKKKLLAISHKPLAIYACGPKQMLKSVAELCRMYKIPCQVSLEENMGCGLGACLGCVVETRYGYKRVCKDGPVFEAEGILWDG